MSAEKPLDPATIAARAAGAVDDAHGGVVPGVQPTTTFRRDESYALQSGGSYGRDHNALSLIHI